MLNNKIIEKSLAKPGGNGSMVSATGTIRPSARKHRGAAARPGARPRPRQPAAAESVPLPRGRHGWQGAGGSIGRVRKARFAAEAGRRERAFSCLGAGTGWGVPAWGCRTGAAPE